MDRGRKRVSVGICLSLAAAIALARPVDEVNVFIGTDGTGHTTPAAWYPSGLVQPGPDSGYGDWRHCSGYHGADDSLYGFSQTHLSGTGCADLADFLLQPFAGADPTVDESRQWPEPSVTMRAQKAKGSERASPGYYSVAYSESGIRTEITAASRVGMYRFTAGHGRLRLLVDTQWCNCTHFVPRIVDAHSSVAKDGASLSAYAHKEAWLKRKVWFKAVFSQPFSKATKLPRGKGERADRYVLDFEVPAGGQLLVKTSVSANSEDGVERNLSEVSGWDFDKIRMDCADAWNELLSRVKIGESDKDRRTVFYTSLYHAFIQPTRISDAGQPDYYSAFSLWDTFRAVHPLYTILRPEMSAPFVESALSDYRRTGRLPVMPYFGYDSGAMIGKHMVSLIVDAYLKGVKGPDWALAYEAVTNALTVTHAEGVKEDWAVYNRHGYYPFDVVGGEGVSRTMEVAFDDWCAARFAKGMGDATGEQFFRNRSKNWTNVLDRTIGLVRGRDSEGAWRTPFQPSRFGGNQDWLPYDCTEGNAYQYTWHVFQEPLELIAALGGERAVDERLRGVFTMKHEAVGDEPDDCTGRMGEYIHGNEPSHHILYFFPQIHDGNFAAGKIREICETLYRNAADGLCGNDDCGQMSAWYIFACLGFYPFNPCGGNFVIGSPQMPSATLHLPGGECFKVVADEFSKENRYVKSVSLNGKSIDRPFISYESIMNGGELRFAMWNPIRITGPQQDTPVSIVPDHLRDFLSKSRQEREKVFKDESARLSLVAAGRRPKPVVLTWQWRGRANPTFTVDVYKLPENGCVFTGKAAEQRMEVQNLPVGHSYRWTVRCETFGGRVEAEGRFSVSPDAPRILDLPNVYNMRDLGGRVGLAGRCVRQGLLYRSAGFNDNATSEGEDCAAWRVATPRFDANTASEIKRVTGIRTDLDLRNRWETHGMTGSPLGDDVLWVQASSRAYGEMDMKEAKDAFAKVFRTVSNHDNLPLAFHCITGADRTGTVAYILGAALGVSERELVADWETTALYSTYLGFTHAKIDALHNLLEAYPGRTLADKAASYIMSCGFTEDDIARFRAMMLE